MVDLSNSYGVTGCDKRATYVVMCTDVNIAACTAIMNAVDGRPGEQPTSTRR